MSATSNIGRYELNIIGDTIALRCRQDCTNNSISVIAAFAVPTIAAESRKGIKKKRDGAVEGCPNEANYTGAIDRDFIGVSPLERLQRKYFFRNEASSNPRETREFVRIRRSPEPESPGYELHDKIRRLERNKSALIKSQ